jgi:hypothetical protein
VASSARPPGAVLHLCQLAHLVAASSDCVRVHSSAPQFDRSPREGAPCASMSTLTCYRTSRSFHFPFWAVCSLSGTQPDLDFLQSVAHVEKDKPSLFVASLQSTSFVVSPAEGEGAPGSSGPVHFKLGRSGRLATSSLSSSSRPGSRAFVLPLLVSRHGAPHRTIPRIPR